MKIKLSVLLMVAGAGIAFAGAIKLDNQFFAFLPAGLYTVGLSVLWFGVGLLIRSDRENHHTTEVNHGNQDRSAVDGTPK